MEKAAKKTKHWLIRMTVILAVCVMLLVGLSLVYSTHTADAAEMADQTITVSDVTVNRGLEFDVDISISNNQQGIQAIRLFVNFDASAMTLIEVTPKDPVESENWTSEFEAAGKDPDETYASYGNGKRFVLVWVNGGKWYGEGTIATLRFLSKSSATAKDYPITVTVDPNNTLLSAGQKRDLHVENGTVTLLPGAKSVLLYAYDPQDSKTLITYAYMESNDDEADVTPQAALDEDRGGIPPTKAATPVDSENKKYTYTFRGWEAVETGDHAEYKPTYIATPVDYEITFKTGFQEDAESAISWTGAHTSEKKVTLPYAKIIDYDAEIPEKFDDFYSFVGWYQDEACTQPVDFAVMPNSNQTVHGYYKLNDDSVDAPDVTTTELTVGTSFVREGGDDYVLATVSVAKNFGINSLLFAPTFDDTKLEFVGFLYESDSPFFTTLGAVFPRINAAIEGGANVTNEWQIVDPEESIEGKYFLFLNENDNTSLKEGYNVYETGKLITLKFKVKPTAASKSEVSIAIVKNSDVKWGVTRYDAKGYCHYANAKVVGSEVNVVRVARPTPYEENEENAPTYTYNPSGEKVTYAFKNSGNGGYELSDHQNVFVGHYIAKATLTEVENALVTWDDGSIRVLEFEYDILPFEVTVPVPTDDTYEYNGSTQDFRFTNESLEHSDYYSITQNGRKNAGVYKEEDNADNRVTVTLTDTDNYIWANGTTAPQKYVFTINRLKVTPPTPYEKNDANAPTYTFNPGSEVPTYYNNAGIAHTYTFKEEDNNTKNYYEVSGTSMAAAGDHVVTVSLTDKNNTEWADGNAQTPDTDDKEYAFKIERFPLSTPSSLVAGKMYNGTNQIADITLPTNAPYTVTQNNGGTEMGDYDVKFTIDELNYENYYWEESETDTVTTKFSISAIVNDWSVQPHVYNKTYDGAAATVGATAKYGTVKIYYRVKGTAVATETETAFVNSGEYIVRFYVEGTSSYSEISKELPLVISKVRLNKPEAYTDQEKSYTYDNGKDIIYSFKNPGNAEKYDVSGNVHSAANPDGYTVTVSIKSEYEANYIWKGATEEEDSTEDLYYTFKIGKAQLTVPVPKDKTYIYTGNEITFEFDVVEYSNRYSITNQTAINAGPHTVKASIYDKNNYEWAIQGTAEERVADREYDFPIRYASLTDETDGDEPLTVTISATTGFDENSVFAVAKTSPDVTAFLATIAAAEKKGALGQMSDAAAAALLSDKCFVANLLLNLEPTAPTGEYSVKVTLSSVREGVTVLRLVENDSIAEVYAIEASGEKTYTFHTDKIGSFVVLADHVYTNEPELRFRKSAATCDSPAVYYKSCSCGKYDPEDTFEYGAKLGHDYDFNAIVWNWPNHETATATVVCQRDETHVHVFSTTVSVVNRVAPDAENSGTITRKASFVYENETYSSYDTEILPATGHIYSNPPDWIWRETNGTYSVKAIFTCDCGESVVTEDATVTMTVTSTKITYTAEVVFLRGSDENNPDGIYQDEREIDRPYVLFDYDDGEREISVMMLPGESVVFRDGYNREGYIFMGWRDESGALIVKGETGEYFDYKIGFEPLRFTAEWNRYSSVAVSVTDTDGVVMAGVTVSLYNGDDLVCEGNTSAMGEVVFPKVPFANYKLVASYPYIDETKIIRSSYLDVKAEEVTTTVTLPRMKFNTIVEGVGSADGLEGVISEEEKNAITDGEAGGTVNEIVITQKRVTTVTDEVKEEIINKMRRNSDTELGELVEFYDITMWKTTTIRKANGDQTIQEVNIKVAEHYQTNIFPISTSLRAEIARIGGNADNIFVYKRHTYDTGLVIIEALPKVSEEEGASAEKECFFIKRVAGEEYIAVRQREYSVLGFGVSPEPILLANEIISLSIDDWTYGDEAAKPVVHSTYGETFKQITYSMSKDGEYTSEVPTAAGTYYVKAFIPATDVYAAAEASVSFRILKKVIERPTADQTKYVYDGTAKTYVIAPSDYYLVDGNVQTNAGEYVVTVSLTDKENTVWDSGLSEDLTFDFIVEKKKLTDIGNITFKNKKFWFDGKKHSIKISGDLPEGIEVVYKGNRESDLGKFTVTATFISSNPNYDVSEPMTAVMHIRLNWIPIVVLIVLALGIIVVVIIIVEKLLKKEKEAEKTPPNDGDGGGANADASQNGEENASEEGTSNE